MIDKKHLSWLVAGASVGAFTAYYVTFLFLYFGLIFYIAAPIIALFVKKYRIKFFLWGFILGSLLTIGIFFLTGAPLQGDYDDALKIAQHIESRYGKFDSRSHVKKHKTGKIYYVSEGRHYPVIQFYEVTDPSDMRDIEAYAREALRTIKTTKVKLVFYEKQNRTGAIRLYKPVIRKVVVRK